MTLENNGRQNSYQSPLWFDQRPVLAIHFVVETTGVADGFAFVISPPEGRSRRLTIGTLKAHAPRSRLLYDKTKSRGNTFIRKNEMK